jgi:putative MFS transporter
MSLEQNATQSPAQNQSILNAAVIVAALGYFVDIYDLLLFNIVRIPSLRDIGLAGQELEKGAILHNIQMTGMMIGGILWGVLGDKRGRLSVLFGSILLYSLANLANAFVTNFEQYAVLRLLAGIGLAGELGAGITLVAESLPKERRGWGTTLVATVGVSGAVVAGIVGQIYHWRTCYIIGGVLGLALLALRIGVVESGMYKKLDRTSEGCGNFFWLLNSRERFLRFSCCVLIGVPIWYVIGVLVAYSPEFAKTMGIAEPVIAARSIMACYAGLVLGDLVSGALSQLLKSRKKVVALFILLTLIGIAAFLLGAPAQLGMYWVCGYLGFAAGYWAILVTVAVEQFGTNLRATVGTSVPNFVRFSVVPASLGFLALKDSWGMLGSAAVVGAIALLIACWAALQLRETFSKDLDYLETEEGAPST